VPKFLMPEFRNDNIIQALHRCPEIAIFSTFLAIEVRIAGAL
jgi:hypothetical protein